MAKAKNSSKIGYSNLRAQGSKKYSNQNSLLEKLKCILKKGLKSCKMGPGTDQITAEIVP